MAAARSDSSAFPPTTHDPTSGSTLPSVLHNPSYTTETHNISYQLDSRSTQAIVPRQPVTHLPMHAMHAAKQGAGGASLTPIVSAGRSTHSGDRSTGISQSYGGDGTWSETLPDTGSFASRPLPVQRGKGESEKPRLASTVVPGTFTIGERPTLADNANMRTRIDYIQYQLDCFEPGSEVLPGYRMCGGGPGQRFVGGTACTLRSSPSMHCSALQRPMCTVYCVRDRCLAGLSLRFNCASSPSQQLPMLLRHLQLYISRAFDNKVDHQHV